MSKRQFVLCVVLAILVIGVALVEAGSSWPGLVGATTLEPVFDADTGFAHNEPGISLILRGEELEESHDE